MHRPLDPRITNIAHDADVLDRNGTARDVLVDRFRALAASRKLNVVIPGGVRQQVQHPTRLPTCSGRCYLKFSISVPD